MSDKLIFNCTHGKEDPERATVWAGTECGADGIAQAGLPVLAELYREFVDNGGQVWLCGACTKPRGITEEQLEKGSTIVGAAKVIEEVISGAKTVAFA